MSSHFQWSEVTTMKCCQGKSYLIHLGKSLESAFLTHTQMGATDQVYNGSLIVQEETLTVAQSLSFFIFIFSPVFFNNQANYDAREGSKL